MRKVFLAAVMLVGLTTFAQDKEPKKGPGERLTKEQKVDLQVNRLTKDLDLNDKQVKAVKELVTKEVEKREAKRAEMQQMKDAKAQKKEEAKANMEKEQAANNEEMKKILTPDQFAKWEKMRDERKEKMKEKMMGSRGEGAPEKGEERLRK